MYLGSVKEKHFFYNFWRQKFQQILKIAPKMTRESIFSTPEGKWYSVPTDMQRICVIRACARTSPMGHRPSPLPPEG